MSSQEPGVCVPCCPGNELYLANAEHGLVAYVAEVVDEELGDASYYGVAAVKSSACSSDTSFDRATLQVGSAASSAAYVHTPQIATLPIDDHY